MEYNFIRLFLIYLRRWRRPEHSTATEWVTVVEPQLFWHQQEKSEYLDDSFSIYSDTFQCFFVLSEAIFSIVFLLKADNYIVVNVRTTS